MQVGLIREDLDRLPQNGYSLYSKFRDIEDSEYNYRRFREMLAAKREGLKELDPLDEMINDFNYIMFHQHLFGGLNEFELAKLDEWFNSPGLDCLFQDYCGVVGLSPFHSVALNSAIQYVLVFPTALILDLNLFSDGDYWVSARLSDVSTLLASCDWQVIVTIVAFSLLTVFRPLTQFHCMKQLSLPQLLNCQAASFFLFLIVGQVVSTGYMWI